MSSTTVSAASILRHTRAYSTGSDAIDSIISGGLRRGYILDICGPPDCGKEVIVDNLICNARRNGDHVLVYDLLGSLLFTSLRTRKRQCDPEPGSSGDVNYLPICSYTELLVALNRLSYILSEFPKVALVVIYGLGILLDSSVSESNRSGQWKKINQVILRTCATRNVAAVFTTNLSTKLLGQDGDSATYETGSHAVLIPQTGSFVIEKGHRLLLLRNSPDTSIVSLVFPPSVITDFNYEWKKHSP